MTTLTRQQEKLERMCREHFEHYGERIFWFKGFPVPPKHRLHNHVWPSMGFTVYNMMTSGDEEAVRFISNDDETPFEELVASFRRNASPSFVNSYGTISDEYKNEFYIEGKDDFNVKEYKRSFKHDKHFENLDNQAPEPAPAKPAPAKPAETYEPREDAPTRPDYMRVIEKEIRVRHKHMLDMHDVFRQTNESLIKVRSRQRYTHRRIDAMQTMLEDEKRRLKELDVKEDSLKRRKVNMKRNYHAMVSDCQMDKDEYLEELDIGVRIPEGITELKQLGTGWKSRRLAFENMLSEEEVEI
jgi:hypothetical protein